MDNSDGDRDILLALIEPLGISSLFFVARLQCDLSIIPDQILSRTNKTHLINDALNSCFNAQNSIKSVRSLCNLLAIHKEFVDRALLFHDYKILLKQYVILNNNVQNLKYIHSTVLLPFTNTCIDCGQSLSRYMSHRIQIICKDSLTRGLSITAICTRCSLRYAHSSVESMNRNTRRITLISIHSPLDVFFLCDTFAFTHFVLHDFTMSFLDSYAAFHGFVRSVLGHIARNQPLDKDFIKSDAFAKIFQTHWIIWQLAHFEFMLSNDSIVLIPASMDRTAMDDHFEESSGWWYHIFSVFWSRHKCLSNIKCDPTICSRVIITDGHQKTRRLVCQYNELIDNSIIEMGPIQVGCPLSPLRRTNNSSPVDPLFCRYHQPSMIVNKTTEELEIAKQAVKEDQQSLIDHMKSCNVYRDSATDIRKNRTFGCIISFLSCGVIMAFDESIRAEGMRPITRHLLRSIMHDAKMPEGIVYDAACTLELHWKKFFGTNLLLESNNTKKLPKKKCVDYFHIRTHTRPMCKTIMRPDDPSHNGFFDNINTEMAEQSFSFLSRFKTSLRNFTHPRSTTILMLLLHLKNCMIVGVEHTDHGIASRHLSHLIKPRYLSPIVRQTLTHKPMIYGGQHGDCDGQHHADKSDEQDDDKNDENDVDSSDEQTLTAMQPMDVDENENEQCVTHRQ